MRPLTQFLFVYFTDKSFFLSPIRSDSKMCGPVRDDLVWEKKSGRQHRYEAATKIQQQNNMESMGFHVFEIHAPSVGISLGSVVLLVLLIFFLYFLVQCLWRHSWSFKWCCCCCSWISRYRAADVNGNASLPTDMPMLPIPSEAPALPYPPASPPRRTTYPSLAPPPEYPDCCQPAQVPSAPPVPYAPDVHLVSQYRDSTRRSHRERMERLCAHRLSLHEPPSHTRSYK